MSHIEDPYFSVRDEVKKTLASAQQLYERWQLISRRGSTTASGENEMSWVTGELKNALRSIEWDLEDLEETLGIVEKNPRKFRLDASEVQTRRQFVESSRSFVKEVTVQLDNAAAAAHPPPSMRYTSVGGDPPSPERENEDFIQDVHAQQQQIVRQQDDQLEAISGGISVLKGMSSQIGRELDSQAVMLDEFSHEMEHTESRLDTTMKKIARVMHMSNDRRQWIAIFVLLLLLFVVIVLLIVL